MAIVVISVFVAINFLEQAGLIYIGFGATIDRRYNYVEACHLVSKHVWRVLGVSLLKLFIYGGASPGLASPDMIARFFMAEQYLVGRARKDTANEGQTASYSRIWPDMWGIARVARTTTVRNAWFASTLRWDLSGAPMLPGAPEDGFITTQWFDPKAGVGGCHYAKVATSEVQQVIANDTAYLYRTPIG